MQMQRDSQLGKCGNVDREWGEHMQEKSNRSNRLKLWPLLFTLMIAAFCFALMGPILRGRTSFSHVFGEDSGTTTLIEDEENPLASPDDFDQVSETEDEITKPDIRIAGISINASRAIGIFSTGVVVVAGVLIYLLKRSDGSDEETSTVESGYEGEALSTSSTGNSVPLAK